jgi:uncharacterized protein (DUF58 family)
VRPTRGVAGAILLAAVLHLLARITGGGWLSLAAGACLALPVAALLLRPRLDALQVTSSPVQARVGDRVDVRLVVRNPGPRPSPPLRLTDRSPGLSPVVVAVPALRPGDEVAAVLPRTALTRGWSRSCAVELTTDAPFGLLRVLRRLEVPGPLVVAPRAVPAAELRAGGQGTGVSSRPVAGAGSEVLGLRAWRPGDGARAVSARASARHGRPVVLERERDTGAAVVLLCAGAGSGIAWDAALERSCALAEEAVRRGRAPVLLADLLPAPAQPGLGAVLDWHARLDAAAMVQPATVTAAVRAAGPGGALVLLAPPSLVLDRVTAVRQACSRAGVQLLVLGQG